MWGFLDTMVAVPTAPRSLRNAWFGMVGALRPLPAWLVVVQLLSFPVLTMLALSAGASGLGAWVLVGLYASVTLLTMVTAACAYRRLTKVVREARSEEFAAPAASVGETLGPLGEELRELLQGSQRLRNQLVESQFSTVRAMALSLEARDVYTQGHCLRVRTIVRRFLDRLGVDVETRKSIELAALLHDIGKMGIPDKILLKEGPLTEDERRRARLHVDIGVEILQSLDAMQDVAKYVKHHHEWFDGSGYPDGLTGTEIPLGSRVIAVADSIDAMRSSRPYREALSVEACITELDAARGSQLDPQLVDVAVGMLRTQASSHRVAAEVLGSVEA